MGLMDKVKAQATQLADKAQQAGQAGQAKLAEVQAKRKGDALLLELGGIVYSQQVGRADAGADARAHRTGRPAPGLRGRARHRRRDLGRRPRVAETTGVVDPGATPPTASAPPAAAPPPAASAGPIPQAQYGSGES